MTRQFSRVLLVPALLLVAALAFGQDLDQEIPADPAVEEAPVEAERIRGFLFSADNLLMNIDTFGAGVGYVLRAPDKATRLGLAGFASNASSTISAELIAARLWYLQEDRISPYWLISGSAGMLTQSTVTDDDNWTRDVQLLFSAQAGLGVEFFIFDSLSISAEYVLAADVTRAQTNVNTAGTVTRGDATWTYVVQTDVGNSSRLGIAIYLDPVMEVEPLR